MGRADSAWSLCGRRRGTSLGSEARNETEKVPARVRRRPEQAERRAWELDNQERRVLSSMRAKEAS